MGRFGRWYFGLFFLILDWLLNLHPFPQIAPSISTVQVHILTFPEIVVLTTFLNFDHIPFFFPAPLFLLIIPYLNIRRRVIKGLQLTVLQLQSTDMVLQVLEDAAQRVVDLAEVGQQDGWVFLVRGGVLVELEVGVSIHLLLIIK